MSSENEPIPPQLFCPHCDAKQLGPSKRCWLCEKPLTGAPTPISTTTGEPASAGGFRMPTPAEASSPDAHPERFHFSLATMLLMMTLASVCLGLVVTLPGLGIFACILMGPVFIRTVRVVRHREARGQDVSPGQKVAMFAGSFAVASIIAIIAGVCAFCTFCGVCGSFIVLGGGSSSAEAVPFVFMALGVGAVSLFATIKLIKWNRSRFRREIGEE